MSVVAWRLVPISQIAARLSPALAGTEPFSQQEIASLAHPVVIQEPALSPSYRIVPLLWQTRPVIVLARLSVATREELVRVFTAEGVMPQVLASEEGLGCNLAERVNNWAVGLIPYLEGAYSPESEESRRSLDNKRRYVEDIARLIIEEKRAGSVVADSFWEHLMTGDHHAIIRLPAVREMKPLFSAAPKLKK